MADIAERDAWVRACGFSSTIGLTTMAFPRVDGSTYDIGEIHWRAPDDLLALGVNRGDLMPIGAAEPETGIGGPSYTSAIVSDIAATGEFLAEVMGFECRRSCELTTGPGDGMQLPSQTAMQFEQWYVPGATTGYIVLMQLKTNGLPAPARLGPSRRGIAMWSFATTTESTDNLSMTANCVS